MAELRTSTFTSGDVVTTYQFPETVRDWVLRHGVAIKQQTPDSDPLVTTWPIKDPPGTASTSTDRGSGQSNGDFIDDHIVDYLLDMMTENPDPS